LKLTYVLDRVGAISEIRMLPELRGDL